MAYDCIRAPCHPLRQAARCRIPQRAITAERSEVFRETSQSGAEYSADSNQRLPHSETAPPLFSRTDSKFGLWGKRDHLRRPRRAFGRSDPMLPLGTPDAPLRVRRSSLDSLTQDYLQDARESHLDLYGELTQMKRHRAGVLGEE